MHKTTLEQAAYKVIRQECASHPEQYALIPESINTEHLRALGDLADKGLITIDKDDWTRDYHNVVRLV